MRLMAPRFLPVIDLIGEVKSAGSSSLSRIFSLSLSLSLSLSEKAGFVRCREGIRRGALITQREDGSQTAGQQFIAAGTFDLR
jgi:hypothetical protein